MCKILEALFGSYYALRVTCYLFRSLFVSLAFFIALSCCFVSLGSLTRFKYVHVPSRLLLIFPSFLVCFRFRLFYRMAELCRSLSGRGRRACRAPTRRRVSFSCCSFYFEFFMCVLHVCVCVLHVCVCVRVLRFQVELFSALVRTNSFL